MSALGQAAVAYAQAGLAVFPLRPRGKLPLFPACDALGRNDKGRPIPHKPHECATGRVGHGVHDATRDPTRVGEWWDTYPDGNVGMACGKPSGRLVIDVDFPDVWQLPTPSRGVVDTPGLPAGKVHIHLAVNGRLSTESIKKSLPAGVESVRGDGYYVALPPSIHPDTGGIYVWRNGTEAAHLDELHPDLVAALTRQADDPQPSHHGRERKQTAPPEGGTPYGQAALAEELELIRQSVNAEGDPIRGRHPTLLETSMRLAALAKGGQLEWDAVCVEIRRAADDIGLAGRRHEVDRILDGAWEKASPRGPDDSEEWQGHARAFVGQRSDGASVGPRTLDDVILTFRRWLYLPDADVIPFTLGGIAANLLSGPPVWPLVVGPPSDGKTEVIQSTLGLDFVYPAAELTVPALLSGTPKKERAQDARGGLLRQVGDFGVILAKDFGSVLMMRPDDRARLLAALREIYDGSWTRYVGAEGGRALHWQGKCGFVGGCTEAIDAHHAVMALMGERFVIYRTPRMSEEDEDRRAEIALDHADDDDMQHELRDAVRGLFTEDFPKPVEVSEDEHRWLVALARLVVRCRSAVERDWKTREIERIPSPEAPPRLAKQLKRLLAGMNTIGVARGDALTIIRKVGLDSIPGPRFKALEVVADSNTTTSTTDVATAVGYPTTTTRRALEELAAHGIVNRTSQGKGKADLWKMADWAAARWQAIADIPGVPVKPPRGASSYKESKIPRKGFTGTPSDGGPKSAESEGVGGSATQGDDDSVVF